MKLYTYYILLPEDTILEINDSNILGEEGLNNTFWPGEGFRALNNIINNYPEMIEHIQIIRNDKKELSVEDFLDLLKKFNIKHI